MIMVELPQGVVIEVRRGGHDVLTKLSSDMSRLGVSGYIRIERRPKDKIPRVSQVIIHESQPKLAIHETESVVGGLEALLEIERDSAALDSLISLVELSNEEILRIINLYPEGLLSTDENQTEESSGNWWNNVKLNTSSWRREARLPEQEVIVEAPEYIQQLTKAKLQKFDLGDKFLNYGDALLNDSSDSQKVLSLAGILASHGRPVIVFSRHDSRYLTEQYDLPKYSCVNMTTNNTPDSIRPDLEVIKRKITDFLWENKQAIVAFSDIEYLLSINEFSSVMNMFRDTIDEVRMADHLLLVHCNMEVMSDIQRHTFGREFESVTTTYLDNLVMDAESLLDHPICMELTEEELSWIEQQIKFSSGSEDADITSNESMTGGASNLAEEDISEARENLDRLVNEWQDESIVSVPPAITESETSNGNEIVSNLVEKAFSAKFENTEHTTTQHNPIQKTPVIERIKEVPSKPVEVVKTPRQAIRIKRTKKTKRAVKILSSSQISIKAATNSNVSLPDLTDVTEVPSRRQAIDLDLKRRSSKIDDALENMLTSNERKKSRELSQALKQTKSKTIRDIDQPKPKPTMHVSHSVTPDAVVIGASEIVGSDSSKRRSRESASSIQNTIDIENNYRKWSTEYASNSLSVNGDYSELQDEEGTK
jgi:hypothetical protein